MDPASFALAAVAYGMLGAVVLVILYSFWSTVAGWQQAAERERLMTEDNEPAFNETIQLEPIDLEQVQRLQGLVAEVVVMRNVRVSGGEGGGHQSERFSAFVIDVNGVTHDLGRSSLDWGHVAEPAERLANAFDVPFTDTSYGTF